MNLPRTAVRDTAPDDDCATGGGKNGLFSRASEGLIPRFMFYSISQMYVRKLSGSGGSEGVKMENL